MTDFRIPHPARFQVSGPSGAGKTNWTLNMIRLADLIFSDPRCKQNVIYFYKEDDEKFQQAKQENIVHHWINEKPTVEKVKELTEHCKDYGGSIICIDDWGNEITSDFDEIFKVTSRHMNATVFFMTQNLYENKSRGISLNATHIVIFRNPRDLNQVSHLARQLNPRNWKWIVEAYEDATKKPYSYLLIDNHQQTENMFRIRTNILPHESDTGMKIYYEKGKCY